MNNRPPTRVNIDGVLFYNQWDCAMSEKKVNKWSIEKSKAIIEPG